MTDRPQLASALVAAWAELRDVRKASENPYFRSTYADLADVDKVARPALARHGLAVLQAATSEIEYSEQGEPARATVYVTTTILHASGESHTETFDGPVQLHRAGEQRANIQQAIAGAITYYRRVALVALLCIAADDDGDGNDAEQQREVRQQQRDGKMTAEQRQRANEAWHELTKGYDSAAVYDACQAASQMVAGEPLGWQKILETRTYGETRAIYERVKLALQQDGGAA